MTGSSSHDAPTGPSQTGRDYIEPATRGHFIIRCTRSGKTAGNPLPLLSPLPESGRFSLVPKYTPQDQEDHLEPPLAPGEV